MNIILNPKRVLPLLFLLSLLMHFHVFKLDLIGYHVWRQTLTQINIDNFQKEDFNILHPKTNDRGNGNGIMRLEFPLMQWGFSCFYKMFGDHLVISRILSFIIGLFSVLGFYFLLKNIFRNEIIGIIAAWTFNFSPVFFYYTMNPLPDNFALCCSLWGLAFFFAWMNKKSGLKFILMVFFLSLSALTKLPFIINFSIPVFFLLLNRNSTRNNIFEWIILMIGIIPFLSWYYFVIPNLQWNPVLYGVFGNGQIPFLTTLDNFRHIMISTLPELLINYGSLLFFLAGFYFVYKEKLYRKKFFVVFLVWGFLLAFYYFYEINAIGKVHDYYLFPFLPPIFMLVAYGCYSLLKGKAKFAMKLSVFLLLILPLTAFLRNQSRWNPEKPGFNADLLNYKKELQKAAPDSSLCVIGNDLSRNIWYYYLQKKGWAFENDSLNPEALKDMINKGAKYLYCDSRKVEEDPQIKIMLDSLITQQGNIRVFSLKH